MPRPKSYWVNRERENIELVKDFFRKNPNQKFNITNICNITKVGRPTVIKALSKLSRDGFILSEGKTVTQVDGVECRHLSYSLRDENAPPAAPIERLRPRYVPPFKSMGVDYNLTRHRELALLTRK